MADKDDSSKKAVPDTGQGGPGNMVGVHGGGIVGEPEEEEGQDDRTDEEERLVDEIDEGESTEGGHDTEQQENADEMSEQRPPSRGRDIL